MSTHIATIQQELTDVEEKTAFIKQFEKPFLDSDRAPFYLGHENGVLYNGETVVRLRTRAPIKNDDSTPDEILAIQQSTDDKIKIASPEESRHYFINDKLAPLKDLGIIR